MRDPALHNMNRPIRFVRTVCCNNLSATTMASFLDDKAVVEPPKPKKAKKGKKQPKSDARVKDSSDDNTPDLNKMTKSDKEFLDDNNVELDKEDQETLDAINRQL